MAIFSIYNDMKEAEIFITIQSQDIPLNYNGEKTLTQEGNIDMIDDNIVGIGEGIGEGVGEGVDEGVGEGAGEGVGEDIGGAIGEMLVKSPKKQLMKILGLKTDGSDLEDNMDHVGTFSYDVNNPIMEVGAKYPNVTVTCAKSNCKWRIHASRLQDSLVFQIKTLQGEHTCTSANRCRNKVATQSWVCNRVIEWLRLEGDLSTTELRKRLQQKYHVDLTYSKIFRGKEMALSKIHGHWEYSYQRIYDFKEEIGRRNSGSHVEIKLQVINEEHHFQRVFLAFGPCIQGFLNGCRPYIALDGCHLKGKHRGVLISATSIDGNKSIFPVAFGVVESENSNSWEWFLHGLKTAIGESEGLVFSSDRQKGLDEAVQVVNKGRGCAVSTPPNPYTKEQRKKVVSFILRLRDDDDDFDDDGCDDFDDDNGVRGGLMTSSFFFFSDDG
ncbi:uncharacterized protein LOC109722909 [Ananas comosus]|uniref:Uncharacterized protein LOC109722909 n=1 Tax=Ananas comosus TaxID=4615 RepID=A0A6P5GDI3_ANACO|nr:uncharacterized protein LOC109722909 [Ananas comosus]